MAASPAARPITSARLSKIIWLLRRSRCNRLRRRVADRRASAIVPESQTLGIIKRVAAGLRKTPAEGRWSAVAAMRGIASVAAADRAFGADPLAVGPGGPENSTRVRSAPVRRASVRSASRRLARNRRARRRSAADQRGPGQVGLGQVRLIELGAIDHRVLENGVDELGARGLGVGDVAARQVGAEETAVPEPGALEVDVRADPNRPGCSAAN